MKGVSPPSSIKKRLSSYVVYKLKAQRSIRSSYTVAAMVKGIDLGAAGRAAFIEQHPQMQDVRLALLNWRYDTYDYEGSSMKRAFKIVYFLGMLVEIATRAPHERQRRQTKMVVDRVDWMERSLLGLMFVGMFFIPVMYACTSRLDGADYRLPHEARGPVGGVGAAILTVAVWLFWRSHVDLERNWSPSLQLREGHELVTEGVYRSIRHLMYASMWLWGVAQAHLLQNWIAGWSSLVLFLPLYVLRVPREERMMLEQFGEAYGVYMNRTGRVIPRLEG